MSALLLIGWGVRLDFNTQPIKIYIICVIYISWNKRRRRNKKVVGSGVMYREHPVQ